MSSVTILLTIIIILLNLCKIASGAAIARSLGKLCGCIDAHENKPSPCNPILLQVNAQSVEIRSQVLTLGAFVDDQSTFEESRSRSTRFTSTRFAQSSYRSPLTPFTPFTPFTPIKTSATQTELQCHDIIDSLPVGIINVQTQSLISECKQRLTNLTDSVVESRSHQDLLIMNLKDTLTYSHNLTVDDSLADPWEKCNFENQRTCDLVMTAHANNYVQITRYRRHLMAFLWKISRHFDIAIYDDYSDDEWDTFHQALSIENYFNVFLNLQATEPFKFKFVRKCGVNETKSMESLCCKHGLSPYLHRYRSIFVADDIQLKWTEESRFDDNVDFMQAKPSNTFYSNTEHDPKLSDEGLMKLKSYLLQCMNKTFSASGHGASNRGTVTENTTRTRWVVATELM